jgi:small conductance mechanosensitive channel
MEKYYPMLISYGTKIVLAILVWVIGSMVISALLKLVKKGMGKAKTDVSLAKFLQSMIAIGLKLLLFITAISVLGIKMTAFITILGAAGLAVGLALQGSLANFAGGVLILLFKPFKVGDFIQAQGQMGSVQEIQIFNTILTTPDNKRIIIPNAALSNNTMVNFSSEPRRRVDFSFGVGYGSNVKKVIEIINGEINSHKLILSDPEPMVRLGELADSSLNFTVRVWVEAADYWTVYFDILENVKEAFDKNEISIPFPQMDVHLDKN